MQLFMVLEGKALHIATSLTPNVRQHYPSLLTPLASHFSSAASRAKAANELDSCIVKPTENPSDYSVVLQRLIQEAKPHWTIMDQRLMNILETSLLGPLEI